MWRSNRLAVRLVRWLAIAQIGSVVLGMAAWMLLSPYVTYADVAADTSRSLVADSIRWDGAEAVIVPTEHLRRYAAARPALAFAAAGDGRLVRGSSPELARYLASLGSAVPSAGRLDVQRRGGGQITFEERRIDGRNVVIATAGNSFGAEDVGSLLTVYFRSVLTIFAPAVLSAIFVVPFVVGRALRPLRKAGHDATAIGFDTLDRRLSVEGLTKEVAPFVRAINGLLDRLAEGAARQRRFVANAAHELRTPTAIMRARLAGIEPFPGKSDLDRDARRISLLIDQLLAAARLAHSEAPDQRPVALDRVARAVVADCAPLAIRSGRDLAYSGLGADVMGDADALTSAVTNLVDNAIRAEPLGGTVEVETGIDGHKAVGFIEVRDNGRGIPESERERLFEPFWRRGEPGSGTGLGLAIVREIVAAHGGTVQVADRPSRVGAIFRVELPLAATNAVLHQVPAMLTA